MRPVRDLDRRPRTRHRPDRPSARTAVAALPSLRGRPVSVAPSATTLAGRDARAQDPRRGATGRRRYSLPDRNLEHALPEIKALAKLYAAPQLLTGKNATADAVRHSTGRRGVGAHRGTRQISGRQPTVLRDRPCRRTTHRLRPRADTPRPAAAGVVGLRLGACPPCMRETNSWA